MNNRIATLRERTLVRQRNFTGKHIYHPPVDAASLKKTESLDSWQVRSGIRVCDRLAALKFEIDELELMAGRTVDIEYTPEELAGAKAYIDTYHSVPGQTGHCQPDYDVLFSCGIDQLREDIRQKATRSSGETADFYQSCVYALDGMQAMILNALTSVEVAMETANASRKAELSEIADSCRRIAHKKPETFRDAIQLVWFVMLAHMSGDIVHMVGPGRLDRVLLPYHKAADRDKELALIESLYLFINDYSYAGVAFAVMVGGRNPDGSDATNELSYLAMEAVRRTGLVYPTVGLCRHKDTPDDLVKLTTDLIADGYSTPALFNDDTVSAGMREYGVPAADSYNYINSTCVEITPVGGSNVWVASPYFSLCGTLMELIDSIVAENRGCNSFDDFMADYFQVLTGKIAAAVKEQSQWREERRLYGRKPIQSIFTNDCLSRGRDIDDGGARYNWVECSFVGSANLIDSLAAIRNMVFGVRKLTFSELKQVLDADFNGYEALQAELYHNCPKYGNNNPEVDNLQLILVDWIRQECAKYRMPPDNAPFVPGMFCWIMHQVLGSECRATPDGRKAGFPFADGSGPAQGREQNGPTSAIMSVTSWPHSAMIGGIAYNMKFDKSLFKTPEMRRKFQSLVETFLDRGGFETQINVLDRGALVEAQKNPDAYRDLVVRIGGYTDYFTNLSAGMQAEVMLRTSFNDL